MTDQQNRTQTIRKAHSTDFRQLPGAHPHSPPTWTNRAYSSSRQYLPKKENPTRPLISWIAKKLGHPRGTRAGAAGGSGKVLPSKGAQHGKPPRGILNEASSFSSGVSGSIPLPRARQRSENPPTPSIRLSTHRPSSTRTRNSGRSYYPNGLPPFSPHRPRGYPRASTFVTRSSCSPTNSFSISRSSSVFSLASSYLGVDDPDARSYVTRTKRRDGAGWMDDNASTLPLPPSRPDSPSESLDRVPIHLDPSHSHLAARPKSPSSSVSSSNYPHWNSTPTHSTRSLGAGTTSTKPTTIFRTESQVEVGLGERMAEIAQPPLTIRTEGSSLDFNHESEGEGRRGSANDSQVDGEEANDIDQLSNTITDLPRIQGIQIPRHSHRHPRDNPSPYSPPNCNASMLTLASSNFADRDVAGMTGDRSSVVLSLGSRSIVGNGIGGEHSASLGPPIQLEDMAGGSKHDTPTGLESFATNPITRVPTVTTDRASLFSSNYFPSGGRRGREPPGGDERSSMIVLRGRSSWDSQASRFSWAAGLPGSNNEIRLNAPISRVPSVSGARPVSIITLGEPNPVPQEETGLEEKRSTIRLETTGPKELSRSISFVLPRSMGRDGGDATP
jgi:hypothetical protein